MFLSAESPTRTWNARLEQDGSIRLDEGVDRSPLTAPDAPVLTQLTGSESTGQIHRVQDLGLIIGRGPGADVRLEVDGVSRVHARVLTSSTGLVLEDCSSKNGTFVQGVRVRRRILRNGDTFQVCGVTFKATWS